jgi:protein-tyrosine phosphatase
MKKEHKQIIYIPDEEDTGFMEIKTGNIASGVLYRSSSPLKGGDLKKVKGALAVKAGIKCVINFDDDSSVIENLSKDVPWYHKLIVEKKVICLPMTFDIPGVASNEKKLKAALQFMIAHEGPYLIHCFAGVDRTGFAAALIEALMGASLKEICKEYLSAFSSDNSGPYRIEYNQKMKNLLGQLKEMAHGENITGINIQTAAERYLLNNIGLSQDEIVSLKNVLSGKSAKGDNSDENSD